MTAADGSRPIWRAAKRTALRRRMEALADDQLLPGGPSSLDNKHNLRQFCFSVIIGFDVDLGGSRMNGFRRVVGLLGALSVLAGLSACAGDVARPEAVTAIAAEQRANLQIADVSAEAAPGVAMTRLDMDRITERIKAEVVAERSKSGADAGTPRNVNLKLIYTQYDEGSRFARFMLIGLGQIHIDADLTVLDATTGESLGQYTVSKDFAFGGLYGAATSIEDVEKGFARSVAELFKRNT
jgi:hypothetical protein